MSVNPIKLVLGGALIVAGAFTPAKFLLPIGVSMVIG